MDFNQHKAKLNKELGEFIEILNTLLPRYSQLLNKEKLIPNELSELGEIEHFLIEINGKISEIKNKLEHDLFGHSLDIYYKLKEKAKSGDLNAKLKLDKLREKFDESLKGETIMIWN